MKNQDIIESFIVELNALSVIPKLDGEFLILEYDYEKGLQKAVAGLITKYIGFWKSIAIEVNHSRNPNISRYKIPLKFITCQDISDEQLDEAVRNVAKKLNGI